MGNILLCRRHVANMLETFPAKIIGPSLNIVIIAPISLVMVDCSMYDTNDNNGKCRRRFVAAALAIPHIGSGVSRAVPYSNGHRRRSLPPISAVNLRHQSLPSISSVNLCAPIVTIRWQLCLCAPTDNTTIEFFSCGGKLSPKTTANFGDN
jgi:hypothetical protein